MAHFMYLFRLRGRLICDTNRLPEEDSCYEGDPEFMWTEASPDPVEFRFTGSGRELLGATYIEMLKDWEKVRAGSDGRSLVEDRISLEIYTNVSIEGQVSAVTCTPISRDCTLICKDCNGVDYQFPTCRVRVHLVPQGKHGFSGKLSGQTEDASSSLEAGPKVVKLF